MSNVAVPDKDGRTRVSRVVSIREEHKRITRDRLVAAAEALFQENGYRATTVEQIAKLAGTTATTFYRYFKSKDDLASILQNQLTIEVLAVLRKLEAIRKPSRKAVRAWVDQYFEMWRRIHVLCEAYWEAASIDPAIGADCLPSSMNMTSQLTGLLERLPESVRARAQLRLTFLVLALDRIACVANTQAQDPAHSTILDEFADILYTSVYLLDRAK